MNEFENYMNKKQGYEPKRYWVVYMKDGQTFAFDKKGGYLETFGTNMICIMTKKDEKILQLFQQRILVGSNVSKRRNKR